MNITDVRIRKINDESKMKAVVSITFDDEFVVHDIKTVSYTHLFQSSPPLLPMPILTLGKSPDPRCEITDFIPL